MVGRRGSGVRRARRFGIVVATIAAVAATVGVPQRLVAAEPARRRPAVAAASQLRRPVVERLRRDATAVRVALGSRVVLWGDSLAFQAKDAFIESIASRTEGKVRAEARTYGGTATCDWLTDIANETRQPIAVAVLEFSGNALTKCMENADGTPLHGDRYVAAYRRATLQAVLLLRRAGARVYLAAAPRSRSTVAGSDGTRLRALYEQIAAGVNDAVFVDAGTSVLTPSGQWTATLPCRADEGSAEGCVNGRIVVRAPDGAHFCPGAGPAVRGVTGACPRYSSGAVRFGDAMADAVLTDVRLPA